MKPQCIPLKYQIGGEFEPADKSDSARFLRAAGVQGRQLNREREKEHHLREVLIMTQMDTRCRNCIEWQCSGTSGLWGTCRLNCSIHTFNDICSHFKAKEITCEQCGQKLGISPNSKGAFSYQSCKCNEPELMHQT